MRSSLLRQSPDGIQERWMKVGRWWGTGLTARRWKATLLPFADRYEKVITRLFVAEGGDAECTGVKWCEAIGG